MEEANDEERLTRKEDVGKEDRVFQVYLAPASSRTKAVRKTQCWLTSSLVLVLMRVCVCVCVCVTQKRLAFHVQLLCFVWFCTVSKHFICPLHISGE